MWYAVLRKRERGVFIGTLCIRHTGRKASLEASGWEEVRRDATRDRASSSRVLRRCRSGAPTGTWSYSSITSGIAIRMQPCEAALPSE